jgi:hypothetical protein
MPKGTTITLWCCVVFLILNIGIAISTDYAVWCNCGQRGVDENSSCSENYDSITINLADKHQTQVNSILSEITQRDHYFHAGCNLIRIKKSSDISIPYYSNINSSHKLSIRD